jgi:acyl phosphate:glycerol-3-phosphate acyltransferase
MQTYAILIGTCLAAYLLGSFPFGYLAGRLLKGIDIRDVGSGSTGATNVLRALGKGPAIVVFSLDVFKGLLAVLLMGTVARHLAVGLESGHLWIVAAAILVMLGHSKSIWLGFSGGKSVATSLGVLLALCWPVGLSTFGAFLVTLAVTRIVSISSIVGAMAVMALMVAFGQPLAYCLFVVAGGSYVIGRHRANIGRLLAGTEPKLGQKLP